MKILKRLWQRIPRKIQVCINVLATLLLIFSVYVLLECPAFTPEQKFRRMEKAELVGPSQVLASQELTDLGYNHLILAETADAVILFLSSDNPWDQGELIYREKKDPVTVMTVPGQHFWKEDTVIDLPVFVFHDEPRAVRAELELEFGEEMSFYTDVNLLHGDTPHTISYEKTWHLESGENRNGVFCFQIHAEPEGYYVDDYPMRTWYPKTSEYVALEYFSRMMEDGDHAVFAAIPAAVRLYDENNELLLEEPFTIRSVTGDRYAREEGLEP